MAKYSKRADGRFCTTITVLIDGEKKKRTIYGKTVRELDDKVAEVRAQANRGGVVDDRAVTLGEWAELWLSLYKANKSINTVQMYTVAVGHIKNALGSIRLSALKKHMLQNLLNQRVADGHIRSAEVIRLTLKQLISAAVEEQYMGIDISKGLTVPKRAKAEKVPLSDEEIKQLLDADLTPKERAFICLLLYTGLRKGEALALNWADIGEAVTVSKNLIYDKHLAVIKDSPKTDAGRRSVPIPKQLRAELEMYKETSEGDTVFPMLTSESYMTSSSFTKFWNGIQKKVGLSRKITPHLLRHTYATRLYYAGVDIKQAQYLLGHSSISVTLGIYTHLDRANMDNNKLDNLY